MELICINCPNGCRLKIQKEGDDFKVEGNLCPRGRTYAINELTHPLRTLTTTIRISNGIHAVLPVISDGQLPKDKIKEAIEAIRPSLQNDGGDISLERIDGKNVHVKLHGHCAGCPMSQITLSNGVERYLRDTVDPELVVINDDFIC